MKETHYLIVSLLFAFCSFSWAQNKIKGTVYDETNFTIPSVNILNKSTQKNAATDFDGSFVIEAKEGEILEFSFIGMTNQQIVVSGKSNLKIIMKANQTLLKDVVVIGYASVKKKDVTGAITSVKNEDFNKGITNSPEQLIQGKVSGVNITSASGEPGSAQTISIRGQGGLRTGNLPLFVIDGFALDNSNTGSTINPLSFINSDDIESIDVLKDASATAIYGSRGANGVVIITTKRGKSGKTQLSVSTSTSTSTIARALPALGADEFRKQVVALRGTLTDMGGNTNWQKEITRLAVSYNHNINMNGGTENLNYYASIGALNQEGIIKNNDLKRVTGRINLTQKALNDKLKIDYNLSVTNSVSNRPDIQTLIGTAISLNPTYPAYTAGKPTVFSDYENPLLTLDFYKDITETNRIIANISPSYEIIKGLVYKLNYGIDRSNSERDIQVMPNAIPLKEGSLDSYYFKNNNSLLENYVTYTKDLGLHNVSVMAGHSYQNVYAQTRYWSIDKFVANGIEPIYNPGLGQTLTLVNNQPAGTAYESELQSYFGRLGYNFNQKYLLTATFRADGSSRFGGNNKYGYFPAVAAAWQIAEEDFMKNTFVNNLKLRAGWGQTGNQEIPVKVTKSESTVSTTASTSYPLDGTSNYYGGLTYKRLVNPDIQWEVSTQYNFGIDFGILNGDLTGTVDYFNKESSKLLVEAPTTDPIAGNKFKWRNIEDMTIVNKGLEVALDYKHNFQNGFSFGLGGTMSFIDNEIQNLPYNVLFTGTASGSGLTSATINGYVNGQPVGTFYMKEFIGINPTTGVNMFKDANGDGLDTDADRVIAGTALPDKLFSFYGSVAYKGFDMNFNFNGVSGNKVYDNTANTAFYRANLVKSRNTTAAATEFLNESNTNSAPVSTRFLKDGAYLRLNNLSLGYSFDTKKIGLSNWVQAIRISATGQNLFVITKYDGYDPEVNTDKSAADITSYGIDYMSYPKARTISFGLNVTL